MRILIILAALTFTASAHADIRCYQVGRHVVCRDDGGGQTNCGWVGNVWKCW